MRARQPFALFVLLALLGGRPSAHAQAQADDAKHYFDAGAAAYTMGDYQAAIQAFETAYRMNPLPAIAFSLAQAARRQYFVAHDPAELARAIELYRAYLAATPTGGRRADATDALAQLEPLALALQQSTAAEALTAVPAERKTRLLVRCEAPGARIALDGGAQQPAPLIVETVAGPHQVRVEAPGFFAGEQRVTAVAGELVPVEVNLRERPAVVLVGDSDGADVYVDGALAVDAARSGRVALAAGRHRLTFAKRGYRLESRRVQLRRGETRKIVPQLKWTDQRVAAITLFAVGGATLAGGLALTGLALDREQTAQDLAKRRESTALSPHERDRYEDARESRDRWRVAAVAGLAASAGCLLTGFLLYQLDTPNPLDAAPRFAVGVRPGGRGVALQAGFRAGF